MLKRICGFISSYMEVIILVSAFVAFFFPSAFSWLSSSVVNPLLGLVMLGMGLSLDFSEFKSVFTHPRNVLIGCVAQFVIMPLVAFLLVHLLSLPVEVAVGVVLVGCCPGGTASNIITYLSKGDLSLSVAMTSTTTILAPVMTPFLTWLLIGADVDVDVFSMFQSIFMIVLFPIALGFLVKRYLPSFAKSATAYLPSFSVLAIALIVIVVVSLNAAKLQSCGFIVILAVVLHNVFGLLLGYFASKLAGMNKAQCRAVSIEVGMQNSGLAASLALTSFAQYPLAAVPGAVFSVWHNLSGAVMARIYSSRAAKDEQ